MATSIEECGVPDGGDEVVVRAVTNMLKAVCSCAVLIILMQPMSLLCSAELKGKRSEPVASDCQLKIEGKFVKMLTLVDEKGGQKTLKNPGPSVSLPAGKYRLQQIELEGGYSCPVLSTQDGWFRLTPGKPHQLKVGAALTPKVKATRQGRILKLDFEMLDGDGRRYTGSDRANPPQFTVSKDGREIGSGSFEYG